MSQGNRPQQGPPATPPGAAEGTVHDLLGVGFGPSNMALAVLLEEEAEAAGDPGIRRLFLEARDQPAWHPGMLLEGSLLQITVLKDLATVRNPCSRFTFLKYLQERGRLFDFLNLRDLFPSRMEFNDYLRWVAEHLDERVRYGREVLSVEPLPAADGGVDLLEVTARGAGGVERYRTRNLVLATGGVPWAPEGIELGTEGPILHAHRFMHRIRQEFPEREAPYRFAIVGGGQSGAELFLYLLEHYPNAQVTAVLRRFGYKPVDESDFTNTIFFPEMVDFVYDLPEDRRRAVVDSFRDVNYAVVDHPLIRRIYRTLYDQRVAGRPRGHIRPFLEVERAWRQEDAADGRVRIEVRDVLRGGLEEMAVDGLIVATGYRWGTRHRLLEGLSPYLERQTDGEYRVERDYGIAAVEGFRPRVFLQGYCEATHGISETVLSLLPMRAQDIWHSLRRRLAEETPTAPALTAVPESAGGR